jgi:acyl-CoA dehydrogenase
MVDFDLTESQIVLRKKAREFAKREIQPVASYFDEMDQIPIYILRKAWEEGLMNLSIPADYGGVGYGMMEASLMTEEIAAACPGIATSMFANSLGTMPILLSKNDYIKQTYLPALINDFKLISFATSETMMGSDVSGMHCKAEQDGDDFILNGTKYWITNAGYADYFSIFATIDPSLRSKGIAGFLVEKGWEGVSVGKPIPKLGQRCSNTTAIKLDNVRVPKKNVLALPGEGFPLAMRTFSITRPGIGAFACGAARTAMEYALEYAKKRKAFGQAIGDFQAIGFKIAEMFQKIETIRLMVWRSSWEVDQQHDPTIWGSMTKFYASEAALEVANDALQICAGYGYTRFFPIEKLLRDIRLFMIYEGTSEVQRLVISRYLMMNYQSTTTPFENLTRLRADDAEEAAREGIQAQTAWRCRVCGYIHYGPEPPEECPYCFMPKSAFKKL